MTGAASIRYFGQSAVLLTKEKISSKKFVLVITQRSENVNIIESLARILATANMTENYYFKSEFVYFPKRDRVVALAF